ncbi:GATA zinc finger domain-containing protein 14-like [Schistocerca cancellata]|uniref:GATA zinc finger domain-containing protein 14-like n=1 Tax=Schistocerca cancellata TaxID=274614 RepID=UPI00211877B0|nr:GATA zinc finger domain-containing protein 14-like [Schistocerca cancellata]
MHIPSFKKHGQYKLQATIENLHEQTEDLNIDKEMVMCVLEKGKEEIKNLKRREEFIEEQNYMSHLSQFRDERNNNWTRQGYSHNTNRDQNRHHPYDNRWQNNSYRERSLFHSNECDRDNHRNRQYGNQNNYYQGRQNNFRRNGPPRCYDSGRNSPSHDRQTRNYVNY